MKDWLDPTIVKQQRTGLLEQRERVRSAPKKVAKPWLVCWMWKYKRTGKERVFRRAFADEDQARRFLDKEARRFACHPNTGTAWGPARFWLEGPNVRGNAHAPS